MKNLLLPLFAMLCLFACEKENTTDLIQEEVTYEDGSATDRGQKRNVCHNGNIIRISVNAIPAHQGHSDAIDMDEDGYFDKENPCSETDCDDTIYDPDNCSICSLPPDPGPCLANTPRWYFDAESGTCKPFTYGGCRGNANNFPTEQSCLSACDSE